MRKGQIQVMVFILLLALFIVLYVLTLPPETREELLNQTFEEENEIEEGSYAAKIILSEVPGLVFPTTQNFQTHKLQPIHLYINDEPEISHISNSFEISRNLFKNTQKKLTFHIDKDKLYEQYLLVFDVDDYKGNLIITLNDETIFAGEAIGLNLLTLHKDYIQEKNTLVFSLESSIFTSFYEIGYVDLKINYETSKSEQTIQTILTEDEKLNLASSELNFDIFCNNLKDTSTLKLNLNNKQILQQEISCKFIEKTVEIDKTNLAQGENLLKFSIDTGDFNIENIILKNELTKKQHKQYPFIVSDQDFDLISDNKITANLELTLAESVKVADIYINSYQITLDTTENTFKKDISDLVQEGQNIMEIVPRNYFEITSLSIRLDD